MRPLIWVKQCVFLRLSELVWLLSFDYVICISIYSNFSDRRTLSTSNFCFLLIRIIMNYSRILNETNIVYVVLHSYNASSYIIHTNHQCEYEYVSMINANARTIILTRCFKTAQYFASKQTLLLGKKPLTKVLAIRIYFFITFHKMACARQYKNKSCK